MREVNFELNGQKRAIMVKVRKHVHICNSFVYMLNDICNRICNFFVIEQFVLLVEISDLCCCRITMQPALKPNDSRPSTALILM